MTFNMLEDKVACDIDGVLANFDLAFCRAAERVLGLVLAYPATTWSLQDSYGISKEEEAIVWTSDELLEEMARAEVLHKGLEYARAMGPGSFYVTARGSSLKHANAADFRCMTIRWLIENELPDFPVVFTDDKVTFCQAHGIDYAIDDAPHHARDYSSAGITVLMPLYEYNSHIEHELVVPIHGWR